MLGNYDGFYLVYPSYFSLQIDYRLKIYMIKILIYRITLLLHFYLAKQPHLSFFWSVTVKPQGGVTLTKVKSKQRVAKGGTSTSPLLDLNPSDR